MAVMARLARGMCIIMRAALFVGIWICGGGVDDVRHRARSMSVCVYNVFFL